MSNATDSKTAIVASMKYVQKYKSIARFTQQHSTIGFSDAYIAVAVAVAVVAVAVVAVVAVSIIGAAIIEEVVLFLMTEAAGGARCNHSEHCYSSGA
jgi:hypothetical protein